VQLEQSSHEPQRAHEQSETLPSPGWQSQNGPFRVAQDTSSVAKAGRTNMPQPPADISCTTTAVRNKSSMLWREIFDQQRRKDEDVEGRACTN
jgi:hypothetical protein